MNRLRHSKILIIVVFAVLLLAIPMSLPGAKKLVTNIIAPLISPPTTVATSVDMSLARGEKLVGICLPEESVWKTAGEQLKSQLVSLGYQVKLVYSDGTAQKQNAQLLELIQENADCLVVAPVDSVLMTDAAEAALKKNIPILSYGSLLMDTEATAGYICYDYEKMGAAAAEFVVDKLKLDTAKAESRVHTVELFMGAPEDYNAVQFYNGVFSVLDPYRKDGVLEFKSHRTTFESCCIYDWSSANAQAACTKRLTSYDKDSAPDACICASDNIAAGVIASLDEAGKTSLVTGNGNTDVGKTNMAAGKQQMSFNTNLDESAVACAAMVDWVLFAITPGLNMGEVSNNAATIPTALCGFTPINNE